MRITIDEERCTGHGRCYALAPELFEPDVDGHGTVIVDDITGELVAAGRKAALNCPERAIELSD